MKVRQIGDIEPNLWIGHIDVKADTSDHFLSDVPGAIVIVLALASNGANFEHVVTAALNEEDMTVISISDAELFSTRLRNGFANDGIKKLATYVNNESPVLCHTFFPYLSVCEQ